GIKNEGQLREIFPLADFHAKPEAVHAGHEDVRYDAVHAFPLEDFERLAALGRFQHGVPLCFQLQTEQLAVEHVVVGDEKFHEAARRSQCARRRTWKLVRVSESRAISGSIDRASTES